jgi:hypothetical protein
MSAYMVASFRPSISNLIDIVTLCRPAAAFVGLLLVNACLPLRRLSTYHDRAGRALDGGPLP